MLPPGGALATSLLLPESLLSFKIVSNTPVCWMIYLLTSKVFNSMNGFPNLPFSVVLKFVMIIIVRGVNCVTVIRYNNIHAILKNVKMF